MRKIEGMTFNTNFFNNYMGKIFAESFAYTSSALEKAFEEKKAVTFNLKRYTDEENCKYAKKLISTEEGQALYSQRQNEIYAYLVHKDIPKEKILIDAETMEYSISLADFEPYIPATIRPYRNKPELEQARQNGLLEGEKYEEETLISRIETLISLLEQKVKADGQAKNSKKGFLDAFIYAMSLKQVSITDIIDINYKVNVGQGLKRGYKQSDNVIIGASFETCPKELVGLRMQELMNSYENEWSKEIPEYNENDEFSSQEEQDVKKNAYYKAICEREAKFHIAFERIHPFPDGNGRTGRIVTNQHLLLNNMAPIIIPTDMRSEYLRCIATEDYKTLGSYFRLLSSLTLTQLISQYRNVKKVPPEVVGEDDFSKETEIGTSRILKMDASSKKETNN